MIIDDIKAYRPCCEQERRDKQLILDFVEKNDDAFLRTNLIAHMTASAWVVNPPRTKVLMVYHKSYDSWSWTGGHADGERDLLPVALREVREETGLTIENPRLCGIKQFDNGESGRYVVLLYRADRFSGALRDSEEGPVFWIDRAEIPGRRTLNSFCA